MSLLALSNELLLQIFSEHNILSTRDYVQLIHTCRRFHHIALPQLYHTVTLSWGGQLDLPLGHHKTFARTLKSYLTYGAWVRSARVFWSQHEKPLSDTMFSTLLSFSLLENLFLKGTPVIEMLRFYNQPPPPPPWQNSAFAAFLERCSELTVLKRLDIEYRNLRVHEIVKLYTIPGLEYLKCNKFDNALECQYTSAKTLTLSIRTAITHLEFWYSSQPEGLFAEYLLAPHPSLEELVWVIDTGYTILARSPRGYLKAFDSQLSHLTKLHLSCTNSKFLKRGLEMDFKPFVVLKELDVHHRLIFGEQTSPGTRANKDIDRDTIVERLPVSLESLTITFDCGSGILKSKPSEKIDYDWILALGKHKKASFAHLSRVVLLERAGWDYIASSVVDCAATTWIYPKDVQDVYDEARIVLLGLNRVETE